LGTAESRRRWSPAEAEEAAGGAPVPALVGATVVPAHSRRDAAVGSTLAAAFLWSPRRRCFLRP